jgi:hypothetical protein
MYPGPNDPDTCGVATRRISCQCWQEGFYRREQFSLLIVVIFSMLLAELRLFAPSHSSFRMA